jgi:hypothetical protein
MTSEVTLAGFEQSLAAQRWNSSMSPFASRVTGSVGRLLVGAVEGRTVEGGVGGIGLVVEVEVVVPRVAALGGAAVTEVDVVVDRAGSSFCRLSEPLGEVMGGAVVGGGLVGGGLVDAGEIAGAAVLVVVDVPSGAA